jgi:hypothetical protein
MMIIDVTFAEFQRYKVNKFGFYWCETDKEFILAKPQESVIVRCVVAKTFYEEDITFKIRIEELGIRVEKITFFDKEKPVKVEVGELGKEEVSPVNAKLKLLKMFSGGGYR